jgi:hypothetical protein
LLAVSFLLLASLPPALTLVSCSAYFSTLKMEAIRSSETSVDSQRTTWRYIPEDGTVLNYRCENLKSYKGATFIEIWTADLFKVLSLRFVCFGVCLMLIQNYKADHVTIYK